MSWDYSGDPNASPRDSVRYLIGDTCSDDPLVQNEEIAWANSKYSDLNLASAVLLRGLAARFSRKASVRVGDVSKNCTDIARAFADRANELDPLGLTIGSGILALPSFGGLTYSEKETLADDTDAVQPFFEKGQDDIPGGPDEGAQSIYGEYYRW